MNSFLLVAFGGAIGAILRHMAGKIAMRLFGRSNIYTGTLFANLIGCLFAGAVLSLYSHTDLLLNDAHLFLTVGIAGSFTTFSTFAIETYRLLDQSIRELSIYLFYQLVGAFVAFLLGYSVVLSVLKVGGYA